jgi:hypothetical protein
VFLGFFERQFFGQAVYKYLLKSTPELESTPAITILIVLYYAF